MKQNMTRDSAVDRARRRIKMDDEKIREQLAITIAASIGEEKKEKGIKKEREERKSREKE